MRISRLRDESPCGRHRPLIAVLAAVFLLIPPPLHGYAGHLSDGDVREAYFFGQRHDLSVARFFEPYEKKIVGARSGPHVRAIAVRTPYSSVVLRSYKGGSTYTAHRAQTEFAARANVFEVVFWIDIPLSPRDALLNPISLLKEFKVELSQEQLISPVNAVVPAFLEKDDSGGVIGAEVHVEYDARDLTSAPVRVQVTNASGQTASADFDLVKLR